MALGVRPCATIKQSSHVSLSGVDKQSNVVCFGVEVASRGVDSDGGRVCVLTRVDSTGRCV